MHQLTSLSRIVMGTGLLLVLGSACGGKSFTGDGGDAGGDQGGTTSTAGTGTAGKGHAGRGSGGSVGTAGSVSISGSGTTGGTGMGGNEACEAPADSGLCDAYFPAWYHDATTGICKPFVYGGCGGNENRYGSLAECQKACPGGTPNYDACNEPSDCVVTGVGCCGICDGPNITDHDLIAYNKQYASFLQCGIAFDIAPPSGGSSSSGASAPIACAPCQQPPPGERTLIYFVPNCVQGQCVVEDLRTSSVTACKADTDCKIRNGTGCCQGCGGGGDEVAVRNDGSFEKLVCGGAPVACPACAPEPSGAIPVCASGRCMVSYDVGGIGGSP